MLENKVYSFSELRTILAEDKNEFAAKYGKGYKGSTEARENEKAVKDITKQVKDMDGGLQDKVSRKTNPENIDDRNKTTLDYDYAYEPSDEYKGRVKSQVHGYTSTSAEKNSTKDDFKKVGDFEGNKNFYDNRSKIRSKGAEEKQNYKHAGLKAHNLPKETYKDNTLFTESRKMKRLHFKNTTFLNEEQMLNRIPDDYKVDGNKFLMKDSKGNEYLVECKKDSLCESYIHTNVLGHRCGKQVVNEALEKFNHLCGYKSSDYNTKVEQVTESKNYNDMLNITRQLVTECEKK